MCNLTTEVGSDFQTFVSVVKSWAEPLPVATPSKEVDFIASDFLKKAKDAILQLLQQQLVIFH